MLLPILCKECGYSGLVRACPHDDPLPDCEFERKRDEREKAESLMDHILSSPPETTEVAPSTTDNQSPNERITARKKGG